MGCGVSTGKVPVFCGRYRSVEEERLGSGAFGRVYVGTDEAGEQPAGVAIKVERKQPRRARGQRDKGRPELPSEGPSTLDHEAKVYRSITQLDISPRLLWVGRKKGHHALVMTLLGPSWDDVLGISPHRAAQAQFSPRKDLGTVTQASQSPRPARRRRSSVDSPSPRVRRNNNNIDISDDMDHQGSQNLGMSKSASGVVLDSQGKTADPSLRGRQAGVGSLHVMSSPTVLLLSLWALSSIETLHGCGWVHRDVKPANLLMGRDPTERKVYLVDFGLSARKEDLVRAESGKRWTAEMEARRKEVEAWKRSHPDTPPPVHVADRLVSGTPMFLSPRAHTGRPASPACDLVSLGYSMVKMAEGSLPWEDLVTSGDPLSRQTRIAMLKVRPLPESRTDAHPSIREFLKAAVGWSNGPGIPDYAEARGIIEGALEELCGSKSGEGVVMDWEKKSKRPKRSATKQQSRNDTLEKISQ